ncbi:MAG: hypothetical protein O7C59_10545, partial [Rickettsia endosymbiont of Ixodes persulcatus]|nr:hypothetical protein [Rickettsia endosymbiont of Ixodes persulcatus]
KNKTPSNNQKHPLRMKCQYNYKNPKQSTTHTVHRDLNKSKNTTTTTTTPSTTPTKKSINPTNRNLFTPPIKTPATPTAIPNTHN